MSLDAWPPPADRGRPPLSWTRAPRRERAQVLLGGARSARARSSCASASSSEAAVARLSRGQRPRPPAPRAASASAARAASSRARSAPTSSGRAPALSSVQLLAGRARLALPRGQHAALEPVARRAMSPCGAAGPPRSPESPRAAPSPRRRASRSSYSTTPWNVSAVRGAPRTRPHEPGGAASPRPPVIYHTTDNTRGRRLDATAARGGARPARAPRFRPFQAAWGR